MAALGALPMFSADGESSPELTGASEINPGGLSASFSVKRRPSHPDLLTLPRITYTLENCLQLALKQNPDILSAQKRLDAARANIIAAKSAVYPALTTSGFYQKRERDVATNSDLIPENRTTDYVGDVRVSQNLYSAGAVRARIAIAKMQAEAAQFDLQGIVNSVALQVRLAFFQTLFQRENVGVQQRAVSLLNTEVSSQQAQVTAGLAPQINANRAQVALVNQEPVLEQARAALQTSYAVLSQLVAVPFSPGGGLPFAIRGELKPVDEPLSLGECLARADQNRPEVASRKLAVDSAQRQITVEQSASRPQLSAFAAYDIYSEPDVRSDRDNFSGYTIGLNASWQIFDGFATRGRVRAARALVGVDQAAVDAIRQQVQEEVRSSYYDLRQAIETLQPQTRNIKLARENLDTTARNLSGGIATLVDVLQARLDLTRSESTELAGRASCNSALARLRCSMGEGDLPPEGAK